MLHYFNASLFAVALFFVVVVGLFTVALFFVVVVGLFTVASCI